MIMGMPCLDRHRERARRERPEAGLACNYRCGHVDLRGRVIIGRRSRVRGGADRFRELEQVDTCLGKGGGGDVARCQVRVTTHLVWRCSTGEGGVRMRVRRHHSDGNAKCLNKLHSFLL